MSSKELCNCDQAMKYTRLYNQEKHTRKRIQASYDELVSSLRKLTTADDVFYTDDPGWTFDEYLESIGAERTDTNCSY